MANKDSTLTQEYLHSLFYYKDGNLYWIESRAKNKIKANSIAGHKSARYAMVSINNKSYLLHRIIWLFHYGFFPKEIDHIDGNKLNNKIENLREVIHNQNQYNHKINKRSTSGAKNVYLDNKRNKWIVRFNVSKKSFYFGRFDNFELAELVATEARNKYHKEFARHF
jgi:hypothetical protein